MPLTIEQQAVADAYTTGQDLIVQAGAGTGKTAACVAASQAAPGKRTAYIAFNRAVADEAATRFPRHVHCVTSHALAMRAVGKHYTARLGGKRVPSERTARILGATEIDLDDIGLSDVQVGRYAMEMVKKFCHSGDQTIHTGHLPFVHGLDDPDARRAAARHILPYARKAWEELQQTRGNLRFEHDHYLKMWQLTYPTLPYDAVILDEAQDTNMALATVINGQPGGDSGVQRMMVGDQQQSLYGWRGAIDGMAMLDADNELFLSQSFRFGEHVADEANTWLELLGARLRLTGNPDVASTVDEFDDTPDAVLCRTNAGAITNLMHYHDEGVPVAIVGSGKDAKSMAQAAKSLMAGKRPETGELSMFGSWGQVCQYVKEDSAGSDLKVFVALVSQYGPDAIIRAVERAVPEKKARVTLTTPWRGKGREWNRVALDEDWSGLVPGDLDGKAKEVTQEDLRACYVAVTRAKRQLDLGPLQQVKEAALSQAVATV